MCGECMKKKFLLLFLSMILIGSCSNQEKNLVQEDGTNLIFFTDDVHFEKEISYYDAILELRKTYPTLVNKMKIVTPNDIHHLEDFLQVEQFPALLLTNGKKIIFSVEGSVPKEDIVDPLTQLLENKK